MDCDSIGCQFKSGRSTQIKKTLEYNLSNIKQAPKDLECCWNCAYMQWSVAIGLGVRCNNLKNEYRVFAEHRKKVKWPLIPGVAKKCEHFENKWASSLTD